MRSLDLWALVAAVILAAGAGLRLGRASSRLRAPWWLAGFLVPLAIMASSGAARRWNDLAFTAPFSWFAAGRGQFAVLAGAAAMLFTTPLSRLERRRDRRFVVCFVILVIAYLGVSPVLLPALLHDRHQALPTRLDANGICRQDDSYTCGPAAAVTALRWLGIEAELGDLTVRALTTPLSGTPPDLLRQAIAESHGGDGIRCEYRRFRGPGEIPPDAVTIAVVKRSFLIDHYVAVRSMETGRVAVGDPLLGLVTLSEEEFLRRWRGTGIVLRRSSPPP